MSSNKLWAELNIRSIVNEEIKLKFDSTSVQLNEWGPDEGERWGSYFGRMQQYFRSRTKHADNEELINDLNAAERHHERMMKEHLPAIKRDYMSTGPGDFVPISFDKNVAENAAREHYEKVHGKKPSDRNLKVIVSKLKEHHDDSERIRQNEHAVAVNKHEEGFDDHLYNFLKHPDNIDHPLVESTIRLDNLRRTYSLATEDLPRFSDKNVARALGEYIHGRFTGRATAHSSWARRSGALAHRESKKKRAERTPTFGIGRPVAPESSEHGPR